MCVSALGECLYIIEGVEHEENVLELLRGIRGDRLRRERGRRVRVRQE